MSRVRAGSSTEASDTGGPDLELERASVARNALVLTGATLAARLSMFALGIVLARTLGAADYGLYSLALAVGIVLQPIADFGISRYLVRETARDRAATEAALGRLALAKLGLLAVTTAVTLVGAAAFGTGGELLVLVTALLVAAMLDGWSLFVFCYFQGRESMGYEARATTAAALVRAAGAIALAIATERLEPVVGWIVLVAAVQAAFSSHRLRRAVGRLPSPRAGHVDWRRVASMGLVSTFVIIYLRVDTILIGWFEDERSVGLYAAAYTLMLGAQIIPTMLTSALQPVFARTYDDGSDGFARTWHDGMLLLLLLTLPVAVAVSVLAEPIIDRTFGGGFGPSADVLRIVICVCPLVGASMAAQAVLRGARREGTLIWVSGVCVVVNVGLNLWAIPQMGIDGAAMATLVTEALNVAMLLAYVLSRRLVPLPDIPAFRLLLATLVLAAVALVLSDAPVELAGAAALASYVAVLAATGVLRGADLARLRRLAHAG